MAELSRDRTVHTGIVEVKSLQSVHGAERRWNRTVDVELIHPQHPQFIQPRKPGRKVSTHGPYEPRAVPVYVLQRQLRYSSARR